MLHFWCFLCFAFYECCLLDLSERSLYFWHIISCTSTILVFVNITLLRMHETVFHEWSLVRWLASPTWMLLRLYEYVIHCLHAWSFTYAYTQYHHAFTFTFTFSCPLVSLANLGLDSTFIETTLHNLGKEGSILLYKCTFLPSHYPTGLFCAFLRDSDYLPRKLCNAVIEPATIASYGCALCSSNN